MIVTIDNVKDLHEDTLNKVFSNDYYVELLPQSTPETPSEIVSYWNSFWFALPDSGNIRRDPFFQICDIAENISNPEFFDEDIS